MAEEEEEMLVDTVASSKQRHSNITKEDKVAEHPSRTISFPLATLARSPVRIPLLAFPFLRAMRLPAKALSVDKVVLPRGMLNHNSTTPLLPKVEEVDTNQQPLVVPEIPTVDPSRLRTQLITLTRPLPKHNLLPRLMPNPSNMADNNIKAKQNT